MASGENSCGRSKRAIAASQASSTGFSGSSRLTMRACGVAPDPAYRVIAAITQSPWRAPREFFGRHEATHADAPVGGRHECGAAMHFERAHERLRRVFENLFEPARIAAIAAALDRDAHAIAVHDARHLRRRQEYGFFLALRRARSRSRRGSRSRCLRRLVHGLADAIRRLLAAQAACFWRMARFVIAPAWLFVSTFQIVLPVRKGQENALRLTAHKAVRTFRRSSHPARVAELVDALVSGTSE